jgi:two-component system NarL family sensor kinase
LLRSQDQERRRIGRDLHDSLGQSLVAIKMGLDSLASSMAENGGPVRQLSDCCRLTEEAIKESQTISYLMYPPMLDELGLKSAISWFVDGFAKRSRIATKLDVAPDFGRMPPGAELAMFRVLQESLTNVHRHSNSTTAEVRLSMHDGVAYLEVIDHGKGISAEVLKDPAKNGTRSLGVGLRAMEERVRQLGGRLEISSTASGTRVSASVPVRDAF